MKRSRDISSESTAAVVPAVSSNWAALSKKIRRTAAEACVPAPASKGQGGSVQRPMVGDKSLPGHTSDALVAARTTVSGPFPAPEPKGEHARVLALDCEMVGVGYDGKRSALAQVVIVDWSGNVLLNRYVRPAEAVTDFRTFVSGITPAHLKSAEPLMDVQRDVAALLHGRVLVGHGLENDMKALLLSHPASMTRDTAKFQTLCWRAGVSGKWRASKLKILAEKHLQLNIQVKGAAHEPAEDARTALALYKLFRREWEYSLLSRPAGKGAAKK